MADPNFLVDERSLSAKGATTLIHNNKKSHFSQEDLSKAKSLYGVATLTNNIKRFFHHEETVYFFRQGHIYVCA